MLRIGIPRALHFLQHYPLWRTFFEELGVEVVVSPPTNRDMLAAGAEVVADVTCLPVKVYAGHVAWLRDSGEVDFVFIPAIRSVKKDAFHCSKFQALPDLIKATVPACPPMIDLEIDFHRRKISPADAFRRLGRQFTWNPLKVRHAWARACEVDDTYHALMVDEKLTYLEALERVYGREWAVPGQGELSARLHTGNALPLTIALVGHPYCLYDDYITHNLVARLRRLGARLVTSEMVSTREAQEGIERTTGQVRWFYEDWMSGAAGHYLGESKVDGIIAVLAFTCGPDSAMVETIARRAHALQRSFMSLVLDEHGSAAGMVTRLEAFVDMIARQKQPEGEASSALEAFLGEEVSHSHVHARALSPSHESQGDDGREAQIAPPNVLREIHKPCVGFPRMGTTVVPLKSLLEGVGARVELGPPLSNRTISLGVRHSPEFICTPYKYILGNMIEMLEAGVDTLLYVDGPELCRNGCYTQLLGDVLHDLGYKFRLITTAILEDGVFGLPELARQLTPTTFSWRNMIRQIRLALAKMDVLDEIERRVQHLRPREITQGSADKVWEEGIARVDEASDLGAVKRVKRDVMRKLEQVFVDPTRQPVRIATTGEYYAVLDPFYNLDLERELGKLGAEVHRTIMMSNWAIGSLVLDVLGFPSKPEIEKAAKPYLRWNIAGEGWETIGQTVIHAKKGFDGIVETLPFTCIPEVTALNILPRVSRDLNMPVISFIFDEQSGRAGMRTRLEAFVDLLYRRREARGGQVV